MQNRHNKFREYIDSIGISALEVKNIDHTDDIFGAVNVGPSWFNECDYRIAGDRHWRLRLKWINSDFTLPIQCKRKDSEIWADASEPEWRQEFDYREKTDRN